MDVVRFGLADLFRLAVARVATQDPPSQPRHANQGDQEGDAHREPGRDPFAGEHDHSYTGAGSGSGSAGSSPASRRSRSGMKLRTGGTLSKLYGGGGEVVAHSSVLARQGSLPAISPPYQLRITLMKKSRTENAIRNDDTVMIMLVVAQAGLA